MHDFMKKMVMSCRPRNDSSCASFGTDGGVQFFVRDRRGVAIVPRLVFDCLTATKGRSSSEESSESESDDSTTRWRPFLLSFFVLLLGLRLRPKLVQPLDHVLYGILGLLRDDVRGHVAEDLLDLVLGQISLPFLLLVRDIAVGGHIVSGAPRRRSGVRRRGVASTASRRRGGSVGGVAADGAAPVGWRALRGHRRAGTVRHGAKARLGYGRPLSIV